MTLAVAWMLRSGILNGISIGLLLPLVAGAAGGAEEALVETCRRAASDAERIACLEAALAEKHSVSNSPAARESARNPEPRSEPKADAAAARHRVDGIGARQVRARNQSSDIEASLESARGLRVARYVEVPYRRLQVELADGQVWRQIVGDTQELRVSLERNQTVDIEESRLGGYKLRLNEIERTIRVERIR